MSSASAGLHIRDQAGVNCVHGLTAERVNWHQINIINLYQKCCYLVRSSFWMSFLRNGVALPQLLVREMLFDHIYFELTASASVWDNFSLDLFLTKRGIPSLIALGYPSCCTISQCLRNVGRKRAEREGDYFSCLISKSCFPLPSSLFIFPVLESHQPHLLAFNLCHRICFSVDPDPSIKSQCQH